MRYRVEGMIAAPPERVLALYHDRLETIAAELPEIARVEVLERTPTLTRMRWFAQGDIPRALHKIVSPEDLSWEDRIEWDFEALAATVQVRRPGMKAVRCDSKVSFAPHESGTFWRADGDLKFDVPLFGGMLERFFLGHVQENTRRFFELLGKEAGGAEGAA